MMILPTLSPEHALEKFGVNVIWESTISKITKAQLKYAYIYVMRVADLYERSIIYEVI